MLFKHRYSILFITYLTLGYSVGQDVPFFRQDYKYVENSQVFYKLHEADTWSQAMATCRGEGAELATPVTFSDARELLEQMTVLENIWIGLHDQYAEGVFITSTGRPMSEVYTDWLPNTPDDWLNNEDCVMLNVDMKNDDQECNTKYRYICKKDRASVTNNSLCETYDTEYFYSIAADRCYKLHRSKRNWSSAFWFCGLEQSALAIINSPEEAKVLVDALSTTGENDAFLGFNDLLSGEFLTIEGQSLHDAGYDKWNPGEPNNSNNDEHCGSLFGNGNLNDIQCQRSLVFFCEKRLTGNTNFRIDIKSGGLVINW